RSSDLRVGKLFFQQRDLAVELLDPTGKGFKRVFLLVRELSGALPRIRLRRLAACAFPARSGAGGFLASPQGLALALRHHVGEPARILDPAPVALRRDGAGHGAVQKVAVMAHENDRARKALDQLLEKI